VTVGLPGSGTWRDIRIAAGETDFRGEPLQYEIAQMRIFVTTLQRCIWHHVRVGDVLSVSYKTRRYTFTVQSIDPYDSVDVAPSFNPSRGSVPLGCRRA
jgi:hypothetical protein